MNWHSFAAMNFTLKLLDALWAVLKQFAWTRTQSRLHRCCHSGAFCCALFALCKIPIDQNGIQHTSLHWFSFLLTCSDAPILSLSSEFCRNCGGRGSKPCPHYGCSNLIWEYELAVVDYLQRRLIPSHHWALRSALYWATMSHVGMFEKWPRFSPDYNLPLQMLRWTELHRLLGPLWMWRHTSCLLI